MYCLHPSVCFPDALKYFSQASLQNQPWNKKKVKVIAKDVCGQLAIFSEELMKIVKLHTMRSLLV